MKKLWHIIVVTALVFAGLLPGAAKAQSLSDWTENNFIDFVLRGQTWTIAASLDIGLSTTACSDSSVGTEVVGGSYARASVTRSLANFSGTQAAGSTVASSGTGGQSSNNVAIAFPVPSAGWGNVGWVFGASGANIVFCQALTLAKTINTGDTVTFPIAALSLTMQ
jgi:hypothetical protein